ncbi:protein TRIGALACTOSYLDIACYLGLYCEROL 4, chloroplastic [Coffea eugenioides]|uniref:protein TRIGALACTOSYLDIACYLGLYCEROL 4, chloroplastic n=1 Tax=Coffea eugenioides TaxID=49369 RepID=UPI000F6100B1|nr:protein TRIGALACTOSYLDIACYLGLYCEROL 4, chloroplastic [Coffea eugenioides]
MTMKKLRWAMDSGFWDLDMSTPVTLDGKARPVAGDPLPLGVSRGARLSRPRQIDFFQRFMAAPFVPSFTPDRGLALERVFSLPLPSSIGERWFATLLGQFNIQKFVTSIKKDGTLQMSEPSWLQRIKKHLSEKSLYAFNLCSELLVTPDDTLLLSYEGYGDEKNSRTKAVLHHKFPHHNLIVEAAGLERFVDHNGNHWDVPFSLAADVASVPADSSTSYHLCINHVMGSPNEVQTQSAGGAPAALLPGLCAKCAVSFKKNANIWTSEAPKLSMVQPYDIFLSDPHISVSTLLGAVVTAFVGNTSIRTQGEHDIQYLKGSGLQAQAANSAISADLFASAFFSAQHGNFQRLFLDLTRINVRLDFPSGLKFLSGAARVGYNLYNSQEPSWERIETLCPKATLSFQQQIAGPFSLRVDSEVALDLKKGNWYPVMNDPVFAVEYALQVLGSAKAVAWYSPKQREFMLELRFFET